MYYINDGLYGSFNCVLYDHAQVVCDPLMPTDPMGCVSSASAMSAPPSLCSVWGPTCDGIDCVISDAELPTELPVGSWLYFLAMGAYTSCAGSNFNGMSLPDVVYLHERGQTLPRSPSVAVKSMLRQMREDGITAAP